MGQSVSTGGAAPTTATFTVGEHTKVITDDGRDVEPGLGRDRPRGRGRLPADRVLQGPGEVGRHVHHVRGQAVLRARRLRHGRGRRLAHPARPRLGVHQHRRREGVPRGGRGGPQDPRRAWPTRWRSGLPDEKFGEAITAVVELAPGASLDEADIIAHVKGKLAAYKAPEAGPVDRHHRPGPERQGRLQAPQELGRRPGARMSDPPPAGAAGRVPPAARRDRPEGHPPVRAGVRGRGRGERGAPRRRHRRPGEGAGRRGHHRRAHARARGRHRAPPAPPGPGGRRAPLRAGADPDRARARALRRPGRAHRQAGGHGPGRASSRPAARGQLERMGTVAATLWRTVADAFADRDPGHGRLASRRPTTSSTTSTPRSPPSC